MESGRVWEVETNNQKEKNDAACASEGSGG
jgi:hypothetical protein